MRLQTGFRSDVSIAPPTRRPLDWLRAHATIAFATACVALAWAFGTPASAVLQRYEMKQTLLQQGSQVSPESDFTAFPTDRGVALIDESGPNPVLRRFLMETPGDSGVTFVFPELAGGFGFFSGADIEGPAPDQTGTGSTASAIDWGNTTGWTITGGVFCHSVPSYICGLGNFVDLETNPAQIFSTNFDSGTWLFHGTGFTDIHGRINFTSNSNGLGNNQWFVRGVRSDSGIVPGLPLIGLGAVAASMFALGIALVRRRRQP